MIALQSVNSLSEAWVLALERVLPEPRGRLVHLVITVTQPGGEVAAVRQVLDTALEVSGSLEVATVAETIFPRSLYPNPAVNWRPDLSRPEVQGLDAAAAALYDSYTAILPHLVTVSANRSGTYFGRMVSWPGKAEGGVNQLAARVTALRREHAAGRRCNNTLDVDIAADSEEDLRGLQVYAATDKRMRGFPCLTHIDFTLHEGRLHCLAVYRHQYLIEKAYGNMLGLSWLLGFLCQQTGYAPGELVVHATMADAQLGTSSTVRDIARDARLALGVVSQTHEPQTVLA